MAVGLENPTSVLVIQDSQSGARFKFPHSPKRHTTQRLTFNRKKVSPLSLKPPSKLNCSEQQLTLDL